MRLKTRSALSTQKGESCSPAELCRIQSGERRLENLKKKHNGRTLVACVRYELQIVSEGARPRQKRKERKEKEHTGQALMELGQDKKAAQEAGKSARTEDIARGKAPCTRSPRC